MQTQDLMLMTERTQSPCCCSVQLHSSLPVCKQTQDLILVADQTNSPCLPPYTAVQPACTQTQDSIAVTERTNCPCLPVYKCRTTLKTSGKDSLCLPPCTAVQPACVHITISDTYDRTHKQSVPAALCSLPVCRHETGHMSPDGQFVPVSLYSCAARLYANTRLSACDKTDKQSMPAVLYSCAACLYAHTSFNTCDQWEGPSMPALMYSCTAHLYAYHKI